jgi:hypothetical protein
VARKVRTPPPPRRAVQAPKVRTAPRDERRNRTIVYAIAASGVVMLAAVLGFLLLAGNDDDATTQRDAIRSIRDAGWTYEHPKSQGRDHVVALPRNFKPNSMPRTSGPHSGQTVVYGIYDQPVSQLNFVHNLEHGAVGIQYGSKVPQETVNRIVEYYNEDPNGLIVAPYPALGDKIALTAWTHLAEGTKFDENVFNTFVDAFGFKGPESCKSSLEQGCFRRSNMAPGNQ